MTYVVDLDSKNMKGTFKVRDFRKYGLIEASIRDKPKNHCDCHGLWDDE